MGTYYADVSNEWNMIRGTKFWRALVSEIKRERALFAGKCETEPSTRQVYRYEGEKLSQVLTETNEKFQGQILALDFVSRLPDAIIRKAAEQDGINIKED